MPCCMVVLCQKLKYVQNSAVWVITYISKYDHITPALKELQWLSTKQHIMFKSTIITDKVFNVLFFITFVDKLVKSDNFVYTFSW